MCIRDRDYCTEQDAGKGRHAQADADAFMNPVIFSRAEVLTGKGGDGHAVGAHDHPENAVHLSVGRPGGNGIRTEDVYKRQAVSCTSK